jgi:hypothetical protein
VAAYLDTLRHLRGVPTGTIPVFINAVRHKYGDVESWTVQAFWGEAWQEAWAYPLLAVIRDTNPEGRLWALQFLWSRDRVNTIGSLGISGSHAREAVSTLVDLALLDDDQQVRSEASLTLGGSQESELTQIALPLLAEVLTDDDCNVRGRAAALLAERGPEARAAVPALVRALRDPDRHVRRQAELALKKIQAPE